MIEQPRQRELFQRLSPCGARLAELLLHKVPDIREHSDIHFRWFSSKTEKQELRMLSKSPSGELAMRILTSPTGVELRFFEKSQSGAATVVFFMHPMNFHRTCEAAVDFIEKVALGHIIVARTHQKIFPVFGSKRLRFFEMGDIVGKASLIEKVLTWRPLNL